MPRGFATVAALIVIALMAIAVSRKLERERRLLRKLRKLAANDLAYGISLTRLSEDERDAADSLARAGVVEIRQNTAFLKTSEYPAFKRKRLRVTLASALGALVLACIVAMLILRR